MRVQHYPLYKIVSFFSVSSFFLLFHFFCWETNSFTSFASRVLLFPTKSYADSRVTCEVPLPPVSVLISSQMSSCKLDKSRIWELFTWSVDANWKKNDKCRAIQFAPAGGETWFTLICATHNQALPTLYCNQLGVCWKQLCLGKRSLIKACFGRAAVEWADFWQLQG